MVKSIIILFYRYDNQESKKLCDSLNTTVKVSSKRKDKDRKVALPTPKVIKFPVHHMISYRLQLIKVLAGVRMSGFQFTFYYVLCGQVIQSFYALIDFICQQ